MRVNRVAAWAVTAAAPAWLCAQGEGPVTFATVRVTRKVVPAVVVSIVNRYSRPIVAISLAAGTIESAFSFTAHRSGAAPVPNATILVGEARDVVVRLNAPTSTARVTAVLFEDGRGEGNAMALQHLLEMSARPAAGASAADTPVTSVVAAAAPSTAVDVVATLENLREAPIRAFRIDEYDGIPAPRSLRGGRASYLCPAASDGLISPQETREIWWNRNEAYADRSLPTLVLAGVLWEDGFTEGTPQVLEDLARMKARSGCVPTVRPRAPAARPGPS